MWKLWSTTILLTADEFWMSYRMDRATFRHLVDSIRSELTCDEQMGALRNGFIEPAVLLEIVLHALSGAFYFDLLSMRHV